MTTESSASSNPYSAPKSDLQLSPASAQVPSISEALSRGYDFSIADVLRESWEKINGCKGVLLGAFAAAYALTFVVSFIFSLLSGLFAAALSLSSPMATLVLNMLTNVLAGLLTYPFFAGVFLLGIRRSADYPLSFGMLLESLGKFVPLMLAALLMNLVIYGCIALTVGIASFAGGVGLLVGGVIGSLLAIYFGVVYTLALPLVIERGLSPWEAMETSRKAIGQHLLKVFGLLLAAGVLMGLSAIPLLIGLIWTVPLFVVAIGVLYRTIFGVLPAASN